MERLAAIPALLGISSSWIVKPSRRFYRWPNRRLQNLVTLELVEIHQNSTLTKTSSTYLTRKTQKERPALNRRAIFTKPCELAACGGFARGQRQCFPRKDASLFVLT